DTRQTGSADDAVRGHADRGGAPVRASRGKRALTGSAPPGVSRLKRVVAEVPSRGPTRPQARPGLLVGEGFLRVFRQGDDFGRDWGPIIKTVLQEFQKPRQ